MQLRSEIQIQSIIKAMTDVVLPAVDPGNKLAQEQARLVIGMLHLMAQQLPLQFRFDYDELQRLLAYAQEMRGHAPEVAGAELDAAAQVGAAVLERARAEPAEVVAAIRQLRAAAGAVVKKVFADGTAASQRALRNTVLAMSKEQLLRDRSWLLMQGWEPDPKSVPAIETLLTPANAAAGSVAAARVRS